MKKILFYFFVLSSMQSFSQSVGCLAGLQNNQTAIVLPASTSSSGEIRVFPVVVHIMYNVGDAVGVGSNISDAQVLDGIQKLNDNYRNQSGLSTDMEIEFCLAKIDPNGNITNGIDRISMADFPTNPFFVEPVSAHTVPEGTFFLNYSWDSFHYLNIWVAQDIYTRKDGPPIHSNGIWGVSVIPSIPQALTTIYYVHTEFDGVFLRNDEFGTIGTAFNATEGWLTHEVGHYLNLFHLEEGTPCAGADGISDTPAYDGPQLNSISFNSSYVCGTPITPSCNSIPYVPDNFMIGYVDQNFDQCFNKFTPGQKTHLDASIGIYRPTNYFIKGQTASTLCGCQPITTFGAPFNLGTQFNIGISSSGPLYTPFDANYFTIIGQSQTQYLKLTGTDILNLNGDNLASSIVGDYGSFAYADAIDNSINSITIDYTLDGQRIDVGNGGKIIIGDNTSTPLRSAVFNIDCTSLLEIDAGGILELHNNSKLVVKSGGTLLIRTGANVILNDNSVILVESGGFICVESNSNVYLINPTNVISVSPTATNGTNPDFNLITNCLNPIIVTGQGAVTCLPDNFTNIAGDLINNGGTTIWNSPKIIKGSVFVTNHSTLKISGNNAIIQFADTRSVGIPTNIIVDRGSTLIIENGAILEGVTDCNAMWDGIQVWGDRNVPQLPINTTAQGRLIITNNSIVKDAYEGVTVCKADAAGNVDWNYTGGIISASNSTFKNCGRAVDFLSYKYGNQNNISYFKNCIFETNGRLKDPLATPTSFVSMYDVKGVKFLGCTFQNLTPSLYTLDERGSGIISTDAGFYIDNLCTSQISPCPASDIIHNNFTNLYYGIYSSDATPLSSVRVNGCVFTNNNRGAIFRGMDFPVITNNTFDVGMLEITNTGFHLPYGLYLEYCTGYQVEDNKFTTSIVGNTSASGLDIYYSGPQSNIVYNNTFDNLEVGSLLMESNNGTTLGDGLLVKCNDYGLSTDNAYDVALTQNGTIEEYQGTTFSVLTAANNTFSHSCISFAYDNDFSAPLTPDHIFYTCDQTDQAVTPLCYSMNTITLTPSLFSYSKPQSCPPSYANCGLPCIQSNIRYSELQLFELNSLIDGGNTQLLLNTISTATPGGIQNQLLQYSPYLSDQVLLAAVNCPSPLPPGTLKNIILANSPVTKTVKDAIDLLSLPNGIRDQINAAQTGISARTILESQIAYYASQRELDINQMIRIFLTDTTIIGGEDSVIAILKNENRVDSKCMLVAAYIQKGDFASAINLLDSLSLAGHEDNFCKLQRYIIELRQDIQGCFKMKMDTVIAQKVTDIAYDPLNKDGCANAQALLKLVFDQQFPETITLPTTSSLRIGQNPLTDETVGNNVKLKIFPNPTNQTSSIEINIPDSTENVNMVVMDLLGNTIRNYSINPGRSLLLIQATDFSPGLYLCVLYCDGEIADMQKLVITK